MEEFAKDLAKELSSDQVKKVASALTRLSNEKMKEEKASDKTGKKTKAAKTKTSLVTNRANATDVSTYDEDAFGEYVQTISLIISISVLLTSFTVMISCEPAYKNSMQLLLHPQSQPLTLVGVFHRPGQPERSICLRRIPGPIFQKSNMDLLTKCSIASNR